MKKRALASIGGAVLAGALVITTPVFAHDPSYSGGHVDHGYPAGGYVDHRYGHDWHMGHEYSHGGSVYQGYPMSPYYSYGSYSGYYDHPAGTRGYRGKDARHHYRRGHQHHHGR